MVRDWGVGLGWFRYVLCNIAQSNYCGFWMFLALWSPVLWNADFWARYYVKWWAWSRRGGWRDKLEWSLVLLLSTLGVESWFICLLFWCIDQLEVLHTDWITCITAEPRARVAGLSPSSIFYWPFQGGASVVVLFIHFLFVFDFLFFLFRIALVVVATVNFLNIWTPQKIWVKVTSWEATVNFLNIRTPKKLL